MRIRIDRDRTPPAALAAAVAVALASCRSPPGVEVAAEPFLAAQEEVRSALDELLAAAERKDFVKVESLHLYGPKFSKFDGKGPGRLDAAATRQAERAGLEALEGVEFGVEELKVDVFGPAAVATFILVLDATHAGQPARSRSRATLVWVKDGGEWRVAHEHFSPLAVES